MQFKHLEELFHIGVTGLRVDAAIYHHVYELADMLNRLPWDLVYQELCIYIYIYDPGASLRLGFWESSG